MRFESFGSRQLDDGSGNMAQPGASDSLNRDLPHEVRRRQATAHAGGAGGGQWIQREMVRLDYQYVAGWSLARDSGGW